MPRTFLVSHSSLASRAERLNPWLVALEAAGVQIDQECLLERDDWPSRVAPGDLVLALGGDGTQSTVAAICARQQACLGVLPAGTGNDFARSLGIPLTAAGACALVAGGQTGRIDMGRVNNRLFLNVCHLGLGASVGLRLPLELKKRWGALSYLRHLLAMVSRQRGFRARIRYDDHVVYGRWLEIALANGPSFGGGYQIAHASHFDGSLTLVAVRARPLPRLLLAWAAARLGRPINRRVLRIERVKECRVETHRVRTLSADGEPAGRTPMICTIEPAILEVILPSAR